MRTLRPRARSCSATWEPINPAPPVTTSSVIVLGSEFCVRSSFRVLRTQNAELRTQNALLHGHGLRQVAGLVHVPAQPDRAVVGQELEGDDRQDRGEDLLAGRDLHAVVG